MYLCSGNNDADQLGGYRAANMHLCFYICKNRFSHDVACNFSSAGGPPTSGYAGEGQLQTSDRGTQVSLRRQETQS